MPRLTDHAFGGGGGHREADGEDGGVHRPRRATGRHPGGDRLSSRWGAEGHAEPVVLDPAESRRRDVDALRTLASRGLHAASDYVEDAIFAGVPTVGTRRIGAGPAGVTVDDTFAAGVAAADLPRPRASHLRGKRDRPPPGSLRMRACWSCGPSSIRSTSPGTWALSAGAGRRRGRGRTTAARRQRSSAGCRRAWRSSRVATGSSRRCPVEGRRVIGRHHRPRVRRRRVGRPVPQPRRGRLSYVVHTLSRRNRLLADLEAAPPCDLVLTEVKAAAADVVLPWADRAGSRSGCSTTWSRSTGVWGLWPALLEQRLASPRAPQPSTR